MSICQICHNNNLKTELIFQGLPINNLYFEDRIKANAKKYDFIVKECICGHIQAQSKCNIDEIYTENYAYDGQAPAVLGRRLECINLLKKHININDIGTIVDIGCGQLELITMVSKNFNAIRCVGIDPVPLKIPNPTNIEYYNSYYDGNNFTLEKTNLPNIILLDNVLEHIPQLDDFLINIDKIVSVGDYVYVCVPSCELMKMKLQFQEFIHEHLHYFTLNSLSKIFSNFGFELIEGFFNSTNSRGYNFLLFKKIAVHKINFYEMKINLGDFSNSFVNFKSLLKNTLSYVENSGLKITGVCAGELTPNLAYHMESDLSFCDVIYDTNISKSDRFMPGIYPQINLMPSLLASSNEKYYFVTAPYLSHKVFKNLDLMGVRNIIFPTGIF